MRYEKLAKLLETASKDSTINPEDHTTYSEYEPLNAIGKHVNPLLDKYVNPAIEGSLEKLGLPANIRVPDVSVADRKKNLDTALAPENLAGGLGMGSVKSTNVIKEVLGDNLPDVVLKSLDKNKSKQIADMFEQMKHDPNSPETKAAYDALTKEIGDQFDKFQKAGFKMEKITGENPYKSSQDLFDDIHKNKKIQYYPTESGFGSSAADISGNPLLAKSGKKINGEEIPHNDVFRIVHDLVGHGKNYNKFGALGEEIGYQAHKQTLSPLAQKALTTETRGQNSFVNYGPNGEFNRANPSQTIFADQKIGLLPDEAMQGGNHEFVKQPQTPSYFNAIRAMLKPTNEDK